MTELSEAGVLVVERIRRRRGLLVQPARPVVPRHGSASWVREKFAEWLEVEAVMKRFLTGSAMLPEPMRSTATRIEGNFYPNAREIGAEFRRVVNVDDRFGQNPEISGQRAAKAQHE